MQLQLYCTNCKDRVRVVCAVKSHHINTYIADVETRGHQLQIIQSTWRPAAHSANYKYVCENCGKIFATTAQQLSSVVEQQHEQRVRSMLQGVSDDNS